MYAWMAELAFFFPGQRGCLGRVGDWPRVAPVDAQELAQRPGLERTTPDVVRGIGAAHLGDVTGAARLKVRLEGRNEPPPRLLSRPGRSGAHAEPRRPRTD